MKKFLSLGIAVFCICSPLNATSLWNARSANIAASYIPRLQPGDILMVSIAESTKAQQNNKTEIKDESTVNSDALTKLGNILKLAKISSVDKILSTLAQNLEKQTQNSTMKGEGKVTADSNLTSSISVMVKKIMPNGNLFIEGTKSILINKETQLVKLTGFVRPEDVEGNIIESTKIANAQINFEGKGSFDGTKQPGVLQKLMNVLF